MPSGYQIREKRRCLQPSEKPSSCRPRPWKSPAIEHRHDVATCGLRTPSCRVEQREALLLEPVLALHASAPPFAIVPARAEREEFLLVLCDPAREAEVVVLRRDPTSATARHHLGHGVVHVDLRIGAVNLFTDNAGPAEPRDARERLERDTAVMPASPSWASRPPSRRAQRPWTHRSCRPGRS